MNLINLVACREHEIRLQNRIFSYDYTYDLRTYTGRVEVCVDGRYQSICDIGWNNHNAQVVCNQRYGSRYSKSMALSLSCCYITLIPATIVGEVHPSFPLPLRSIYLAQDVMCNGTESSISQCSYNPPTSPECNVGNHSAAVVCTQGIMTGKFHYLSINVFIFLVCNEGDVRLVHENYKYTSDGLQTNSGVVLVCVNQRYGYICADNWDDREADVVCRSYYSHYQPPYYGMHLFPGILVS